MPGRPEISFGDLEQAFLLHTDGQPSILRLNERYADTLEVGVYLWSRIGGLYLGQSSIYPVVALQQARWWGFSCLSEREI